MKRWLGLFLVIILLMISHSFVEARSHRFLDLQIEANVGADGIVRVTETHTVHFEGTFSGMYQWIDTKRDVEVCNVVVSEHGIPYTRLEENPPGPAGTYYVRNDKKEVYVDWSFEANDETREFQLSYALDNVILKHEDVAEFYYQFIGNKWEEPRDHVRVVLSLPFGAELDEIGAWGHGPLHGSVSLESPTRIVWEVDGLPARTFVEGRVVFPTRLVPGASRLTNKLGLPGILEEETGKVERLQRTERRKGLDPYVAMVVLALTFLLAVYIWNNYGKAYPGYKERYYKQLPANYAPAELAILYRRAVDSRDFTATLLDLARRGYLAIEEVKSSYKFIKKEASAEDKVKLQSYEEQVLQFLFEDLGGTQVTLEDLQDYAKENRKVFAKFWSKWGETVKKATEEHSFFDEDSKKKVAWFFIPALLLIPLAIVSFVLEMHMTGAVCIGMGFATIIVVAVSLERRSPSGNVDFTKWKAFRRYLKQFSRVEATRVGSLGIWEQVLPYAVTLGVADQVLKQLEVAFPNLEENGYHFGSYWFFYHHASGVNRISRMTTTVGQSVSSATSQVSGSGSGGSFSGGGGGGFGGGGGGVR